MTDSRSRFAVQNTISISTCLPVNTTDSVTAPRRIPAAVFVVALVLLASDVPLTAGENTSPVPGRTLCLCNIHLTVAICSRPLAMELQAPSRDIFFLYGTETVAQLEQCYCMKCSASPFRSYDHSKEKAQQGAAAAVAGFTCEDLDNCRSCLQFATDGKSEEGCQWCVDPEEGTPSCMKGIGPAGCRAWFGSGPHECPARRLKA